MCLFLYLIDVMMSLSKSIIHVCCVVGSPVAFIEVHVGFATDCYKFLLSLEKKLNYTT